MNTLHASLNQIDSMRSGGSSESLQAIFTIGSVQPVDVLGQECGVSEPASATTGGDDPGVWLCVPPRVCTPAPASRHAAIIPPVNRRRPVGIGNHSRARAVPLPEARVEDVGWSEGSKRDVGMDGSTSEIMEANLLSDKKG